MKPLRPENDNQNVQIITLPDPATVVKTIAAGICVAGMQLLHDYRGAGGSRILQPPSPAVATAPSDVLTADEVAALLRLDRKTVYDYATRGVIPHQRIGKRMLFSRSAITSWLGASVDACCKRPSNGDSG